MRVLARLADKEVRYLAYPDEGHGLRREANRLDFYAEAEEFLARALGGRLEPRDPDVPAVGVRR